MTGRKLTISIFRYNPNEKDSVPSMQDYELEELPNYNLFRALMDIREQQDPSLMFDFVCRASICGACAMMIDGKPALAFKTLTKNLPDKFTLHPLPVFKIIGDLTVDTGTWFRGMAEKTESWIHTDRTFDPHSQEEKMNNEEALEIYELDRCIECGCCIAGCGTMNIREDFMGAAGLVRIARFMIDPRDERTTSEFYDLIGSDQGVFGCMGLMACEDMCPKQIPIQKQLAFVRRKMAWEGIKDAVPFVKEKAAKS